MQQLRTWAWRVFVPVLLVAGLLAGTAGAASAVPEYLWRDGYFTRADAPVYPQSVDG